MAYCNQGELGILYMIINRFTHVTAVDHCFFSFNIPYVVSWSCATKTLALCYRPTRYVKQISVDLQNILNAV